MCDDPGTSVKPLAGALRRLLCMMQSLAIVAMTSGACGMRTRITRIDWEKEPSQAGNLDFEAETTDWYIEGSNAKAYFDGVDRSQAHNGRASGFLQSTSAQGAGFGTLMQRVQATEYLGKRISLSAFLRCEAVEQWAGLWMRVDGASRTYWFDNMRDRPLVGTLAWDEYVIVLDVPPDSRGISFGVLIAGRGMIWIDDVRLSVANPNVRVTGELLSK